MSMGPLGMIGSVAGTPLSQAKGTDADRAVDETAKQARAASTDQLAEKAAGIGQTEQDEEASDRDADGRRLWEPGRQPAPQSSADQEPDADPPPSKDPTGQSGNQLDLSV